MPFYFLVVPQFHFMFGHRVHYGTHISEVRIHGVSFVGVRIERLTAPKRTLVAQNAPG